MISSVSWAGRCYSSPGTWPTERPWTRFGVQRSRGGVASTSSVDNAGIYGPRPWTTIWPGGGLLAPHPGINSVAPGHLCREAIRHFRSRGGGSSSTWQPCGSAVTTRTTCTTRRPRRGSSRCRGRSPGTSGATTYGVRGRAWLRPHGPQRGVLPQTARGGVRDIPLGEVAEPQDIADTVAFLASGLADTPPARPSTSTAPVTCAEGPAWKQP